MLKQGGDALGPQLRASPLGIGRWSWESPWPRDPRLSEPVRDFCVAMPRLSIEALDTEALPNPVKLALAFLRAVCPREVVPDVAVAQLPPLLPPQLARNKGRRTLVLDLDETLVHCHPSLLAGSPPPALELYLDAACPPLHAHIYVRPFAQLLLELAAHVFEVVVFTASAAVYADKVLDFLDPGGRCVSHRLYRQHCTEIEKAFFKDMRILGRRVEDVVLVDNSPLAGGLTPDSTLLVASWFGDDYQDTELLDLLGMLEECAARDSIPAFLAERYGFGAFVEELQRRFELSQRAWGGFSAFGGGTACASVDSGPVCQVQR